MTKRFTDSMGGKAAMTLALTDFAHCAVPAKISKSCPRIGRIRSGQQSQRCYASPGDASATRRFVQPVFIFNAAERIGTNRQRVLAPICLILVPAELS